MEGGKLREKLHRRRAIEGRVDTIVIIVGDIVRPPILILRMIVARGT